MINRAGHDSISISSVPMAHIGADAAAFVLFYREHPQYRYCRHWR